MLDDKIDIALMVERLLGTGIKFRMSNSYQQLKNTWNDEKEIPTEQEIKDEWEKYIIEKENYTPPPTDAERINELESTIADIIGGVV